MTRSRQTADWGSRAGLAKIVPSSVAVGSGTGSADSTGKVTFSGCSSVSLNDVFSSTYDKYKILIDGINSTTSAAGLNMRLRVSGSDNSSSNYRYAGTYIRDNSATPTVTGEASNGTTTSFTVGALSSTAGYYPPLEVELTNPFLSTKQTGYLNRYYYYDQFGGYGYGGFFNGAMSVTTSYTGFTLIAGAGTMTGTVSVYGYN